MQFLNFFFRVLNFVIHTGVKQRPIPLFCVQKYAMENAKENRVL